VSKGHKDLPAGSQPWANEVDTAMARVAELEAIVRRLTENAGIDMSNPKRGINTGNAPSVKSPVGQKLSSLADVQTYNVADKQVLTWDQAGQKWFPATPVSQGINWEVATEDENIYGEANIDAYDYYSTKVFGQRNAGGGTLTESAGLVGTSDGSAFLHAHQKFFGGDTKAHGWVAAHPYYVKIGQAWIADDGSTWNEQCEITVGRGDIYFSTPKGLYGDEQIGYVSFDTLWFYIPRFTTENRPVAPGPGVKGAMIYDTSINKPLWHNGVAWCDALGTPA